MKKIKNDMFFLGGNYMDGRLIEYIKEFIRYHYTI